MLIGYARVSTLDQNPEMQLDALRAAGCERLYTETASGTKADRPELAKAIDHLRPGDCLVVWKLDRLGRSLPHLISTAAEIEAKGAHLSILTSRIDTRTAEGRLYFNLFGAMAEFERDLIRERTQAGLASARAQGRKGGRPAKLTPTNKTEIAALLANPAIPIRAICERYGIDKTTLYAAFPGGRAAISAAAGAGKSYGASC